VDFPAEKTNSPAEPLLPVPTVTYTDPARPDSAVPLLTYKLPLLPELEVPVLITNMPLTPFCPAFAVAIINAPLVAPEVYPLMATSLPPNPEEKDVNPAERINSPPVPLFPEPATT